jgi:hypothetical protein
MKYNGGLAKCDIGSVVECNLCHICYFVWRFVISAEY